MKYCTMGTKENKKLYFDELKAGDVFRFADKRKVDDNIYMKLTNSNDTDEMRYIDLDEGEIFFAFDAMADYQVEVYNGRVEFLENNFSTERR